MLKSLRRLARKKRKTQRKRSSSKKLVLSESSKTKIQKKISDLENKLLTLSPSVEPRIVLTTKAEIRHFKELLRK